MTGDIRELIADELGVLGLSLDALAEMVKGTDAEVELAEVGIALGRFAVVTGLTTDDIGDEYGTA